MKKTLRTLAALAFLAAAASAQAFDQSTLPEAVRVPAGHVVSHVTTTVGGEITYECKSDKAGKHSWTFIGPVATLVDANTKVVGFYFGPPATWQAKDGSMFTGKQLATAPNGEGNLPLQLVQANPSKGEGQYAGVTYVQRVNLTGGVAPKSSCDHLNHGQREIVTYKSDYVLYKAK